MLFAPNPPQSGASPSDRPVDDWTRLSELVSLASRALRAAVTQRIEQQGLGERAFWLLWACRDGSSDGVSQNELAAALGMSAAHTSQSVEDLRRRGWLEGERSAADRRRQVWRLTPLGRQMLQSALAELRPWAAALEQRFGPQHRVALEERVRQLVCAAAEVSPVSPSTAASRKQSPPRGAEGAAAA